MPDVSIQPPSYPRPAVPAASAAPTGPAPSGVTAEYRPGAHTLNVIGAVTPLKMVPDIMNQAALSAVRGAGNGEFMIQAAANGINGLRPTFGAALMQIVNPFNLFRTLKFGALVSFPIALVQNLIDMKNGNVTQNQMVAGTVADGIGYTVAGSVGTLVGGLVGSLFPVAGTLVGMLVGGAVGVIGSEIYDQVFKPDFRKTLQVKMFGSL